MKHVYIILLLIAVLIIGVLLGQRLQSTPESNMVTDQSDTPLQESEVAPVESSDVGQQPDNQPANPPAIDLSTVDYVGLTVAQAESKAEQSETMFRVVEIDGMQQAVTKDYRPGRINATTVGGVVVSYEIEGQVTEPVGEHDEIIGMTEAEAKAYASEAEVMFRVGSVDGEANAVTMDYRPGRITVALTDGVVVSYTVE